MTVIEELQTAFAAYNALEGSAASLKANQTTTAQLFNTYVGGKHVSVSITATPTPAGTSLNFASAFAAAAVLVQEIAAAGATLASGLAANVQVPITIGLFGHPYTISASLSPL